MKKIITLFMAAALCVSALAGCTGAPTASQSSSSAASTQGTADSSTSESTAPTGETVKFTYVVPGEAPPEYDRGIKAVNEKLAADGAGVEIEIKYIAWDVWDQKINIMLSTGEKFDAFHVMNDRVTLANYASRGALADISEPMKNFGQNIVSNVPELAMKNCTVGGKQYGIPAFWVETAITEAIDIRADILKKNNLKMPTNFDELTESFKTVMANWEGNQKPYLPSTAINDQLANFLTTSNDFVLYDYCIYVNQDGTIQNYYETEAFKEACKNAKTWYDAGLINPDILTATSEQVTNQVDMGEWFMRIGTVGSITGMQRNIPDLTVDDIKQCDITGGTPLIRPYGAKNLQAVPRSSENPDAAVKFFNWLYSDQANFDLFIYGQDGIDCKIGENRSFEALPDASSGKVPYNFAEWMAGNINYARTDASVPPDANALRNTISKTAVDGIAATMAFDASNVQTQYADVQTQISAVLTPMSWGVTDYDSGIQEALDLLKKAGIDDVIEEFKKQFEATK